MKFGFEYTELNNKIHEEECHELMDHPLDVLVRLFRIETSITWIGAADFVVYSGNWSVCDFVVNLTSPREFSIADESI